MKNKILLVDDSKILQRLMKKILETAGHEVVGCADDGAKGLELYLKTQPDFTLMDVTMPNMSGKECLEQILKHNSSAKVIMISGLADPQIEKDCLHLGAKAFISKSEVTDMHALEEKIIHTIKELNK